jgi:hypothetical protein
MHDFTALDQMLKSAKQRRRADAPAGADSQGGFSPARRDGGPGPLDDTRVMQLRAEADGLLMRLRAGHIRREHALETLRELVRAENEVIKHHFASVVLIEKTKIDVKLERYLKQLEAEHIGLLQEFEVENMDSRMQTLFKLNEKFVALARQAQSYEWPQELIQDSLEQLTELRLRVVTYIGEDFRARQRPAGATRH